MISNNKKTEIDQNFALHWNLNGFYNKIDKISEIINKYNPSIFSLNETRHSKNKELKYAGYEIHEKL